MRLSSTLGDAPRSISLFPSSTLRKLVLVHAPACAEMGLDASALSNEDDSAVQRWLHAQAGLLPAALAEDLERIDELTDERGAAVLLSVALEAGLDLRSLGHDPIQVATAAFIEHPAVFERAHGRRLVETLRGLTEFPGKARGRCGPVDVETLETRLGAHFDARGRSAHCRITMGTDGARTIFSVAHGCLVRSDEALADEPTVAGERTRPLYLSEHTVRYRPQRRDVVIFDAHTGTLRVRAGDAATLNAYRRGFGELLHGDTEWFGHGQVLTLEPLVRQGQGVERPTPGLRAVRVVGLVVQYAGERGGTVELRAEEIWPFLAERLRGDLDEGTLLEVTFRVWRVGNSRAAVVRVSTPNRVEYGCVAEEVFRPFLEARGFLSRAAERSTG
ncbi:MAG: hypothetical protein Q8P18_28155 [Pseudomonadota bacterium]|nr:hypothetical protein [Pseudomonadota bacterium]